MKGNKEKAPALWWTSCARVLAQPAISLWKLTVEGEGEREGEREGGGGRRNEMAKVKEMQLT